MRDLTASSRSHCLRMLLAAIPTGSDTAGSIPADKAVPRRPAECPDRSPTSNDRPPICPVLRRRWTGTPLIRTPPKSTPPTDGHHAPHIFSETRCARYLNTISGATPPVAGARGTHRLSPPPPAFPVRCCPAATPGYGRSSPTDFDRGGGTIRWCRDSSTSAG